MFSHFLQSLQDLPRLKWNARIKRFLSRPEDRYIRFLGILLDQNFSFKHYIDLIKMKVSRSLGIHRKFKHIFSGLILRILSSSLVSFMLHIVLLFGYQLFPHLWSHFQNFMIKQGLLFRKLTDFHLNPCLIWNLSIFFLVLLSFFFFTVARPSNCCPM